MILFNHGVHFDSDHFPDPERFSATRFLDAKTGRFSGSDPRLQMFSNGRRRCVGEAVARMELFLFVASLVQVLRRLSAPRCFGAWVLGCCCFCC